MPQLKFATQNYCISIPKFEIYKKISYICTTEFNEQYFCLKSQTSMDLVTRLKIFMDHENISISQFADTCKIPRPTMSQILNGRNKKISDELISKIHSSYPHLSVLWLMFGEGSMESGANIKISANENNGEVNISSQQHDIIQRDTANIINNGSFPENPPEKKYLDISLQSDDDIGLFSASNDDVIDFGTVPSSVNADGQNPTITNASNTDADQSNGSENLTSSQQPSINIPLQSSPTKFITNIVVFYSDNSFQSFSPSLQSDQQNR